MLKGVPSVLSPELLKVLAEMGHGDEIVIGDMHYPSAGTAKNILVRADGIGSVRLIDAILQLMTLDHAVDKPFMIMQKQACDAHLDLPVHEEYFRLAEKHDPRGRDAVGYIDRFEFYERAAKAYAVVASGELSFYGCTILKKGVVQPKDVI
jgi:L-fucose mutarotase